DVAPHGRAGAYGRAATDSDRGHQLRIGPDVDVVLDHRPMLVRAVVVAGDRARTDVDVAPDRRVAHVGQVVRLAALADGARLHLDEVADVNLVRQTRAWPDARVRADPATRPDVGAVDMRIRRDRRRRADFHISENAVRADADRIAERHVAFENAADVDRYVAAAGQRAAHIDARRIGQGHSGIEQRVRLGALIDPLE